MLKPLRTGIRVGDACCCRRKQGRDLIPDCEMLGAGKSPCSLMDTLQGTPVPGYPMYHMQTQDAETWLRHEDICKMTLSKTASKRGIILALSDPASYRINMSCLVKYGEPRRSGRGHSQLGFRSENRRFVIISTPRFLKGHVARLSPALF